MYCDDKVRIDDDFQSLEDDRNELIKLLDVYQICLRNIAKIYNKHDLYIRSVLDNTSAYSEKVELDLDKTLKNVDQKLWDYALNKSQIERVLTYQDKEKIRKEYYENPPIYTAQAARDLVAKVESNSENIMQRTLKKVFNEIVTSYYKVGNNWRGEKKFNNKKKIENKFRKSCFGSWPKTWLDDKEVAFFNDLEVVCCLVNQEKFIEYPNRIGDIIKQNCRKSNFETECKFFSLKMFKNGNVIITFKDDKTPQMLNQYGSSGNMIGI